MKITSIIGKMTGKAGNMVTATVGGETIAREYNPNVANPNTAAQQTTRSKFKLISQLAATMSPVIAIRKDGLKSARNQFTSINYEKARYSQGQADVNLNVIQLTKSNRSFPGFSADRSSGSAVVVKLNAESASDLSRVVYCMYQKMVDGSLRLVGSVTINTPGNDGLFEGQLPYNDGAVVCYGYGIKDLEAGITAKFGNMQAPTASDVAQLLVSNAENMSSVQLTKTAGLTMAIGETTGDSDDVEHFTVSVVTSGNGSATGGGRFEAGQLVTLRATPDAEAEFVAWKANNASGETLSTNPTYSFEAQANVTICAVFRGGPTPSYNIAVSADPQNGGTVSGGGMIEEGQSCTVAAVATSPYAFTGWYENNQLVSSQASYTFTVMNARNLVARFAQVPTYNVAVSANPAAGGTVSGGGSYAQGSQATVVALMNEGYDFVGWFENGSKVSSNISYSFFVQSARTLEARFEVEAQTNLTNVQIDGVAWNANKTNVSTSGVITGEYTGQTNMRSAYLYKSSSKPTTMTQVDDSAKVGYAGTLTQAGFTLSDRQLPSAGKYWLIIALADPDAGGELIEDVYPYYLEKNS